MESAFTPETRPSESISAGQSYSVIQGLSHGIISINETYEERILTELD